MIKQEKEIAKLIKEKNNNNNNNNVLILPTPIFIVFINYQNQIY